MGLLSKSGWLDKLGDFIFGYDFFISYAHGDGGHYPRQLADQLQHSGFRVFLDERVYVAGDDLNAVTKRRIRMSNNLVLVARPKVLESNWCATEVEESIAAGQTPIVIDINETFLSADDNNDVKKLLDNRISIRETVGNIDGEPSERVLGELSRKHDALRVETRRSRFFGLAALVMLMVSIVALWQYTIAERNAGVYMGLCSNVVNEVRKGHELIKGLEGNSEFGKLISTAAAELANLPEFSTAEEECQIGSESQPL